MRPSCLLSIHILLLCGSVTLAESPRRPPAPQLLPETTVAFLRVADARDLAARFRETAMGKITSDEQVRPFVGHLYQSVLDAYGEIEGEIGASLAELRSLLQGEICAALVLPEEGRPQLVVLLDVGDKLPLAERLLDRGDDAIIGSGATRTTKQVGETELVLYQSAGRDQQLVVFQREQRIVFTTSPDLSEQILAAWDGAEGRHLANNRKFTSIMNRSRGLKEEPPQVTWFVDPMEFAKHVTKGNLAGQAGLATAKGLGLDALKALGGGIVVATEEFDIVSQSHALIGHPREGIMKMIGLSSGSLTPEPWVPSDAASYATVHWELDKTYQEIVKLNDFFRGEGASEQMIDQLSERLGVAFETEIIESLADRLTMVTWIEKPARLNSQATLLAVRLVDSDRFRQTVKTVVGQFEERMEEASYRGVPYFRITPRRNREVDEQLTRIPKPCAAVIGDYLIVTDSQKLLETAIATKGDAGKSLGHELDFKLVLNKIERQLRSHKAGGIAFQRPEEGFRLMYELATSPTTRDRLAQVDHPVLQALRAALAERPLPPFSVIAKYLAPGGAMWTYDDLGLHHVGFTLARSRGKE